VYHNDLIVLDEVIKNIEVIEVDWLLISYTKKVIIQTVIFVRLVTQRLKYYLGSTSQPSMTITVIPVYK